MTACAGSRESDGTESSPRGMNRFIIRDMQEAGAAARSLRPVHVIRFTGVFVT